MKYNVGDYIVLTKTVTNNRGDFIQKGSLAKIVHILDEDPRYIVEASNVQVACYEDDIKLHRKKVLSDRECAQIILDSASPMMTFENFVMEFLTRYPERFNAVRVNDLANMLHREILDSKLQDLEHMQRIAKERALYLREYISGNMYTTEEAAKKHAPVQIKNAQAIINVCNGRSAEDEKVPLDWDVPFDY